MKQKILFLLWLTFATGWSQSSRLLKGQVLAEIRETKGVNITNLTSRNAIVSGDEGLFSITAKTGDTLLFTAVQLQPRKIVLENEDFNYMPFVVRLKTKITQLNEIIVKEKKLSAESLGIVLKGVKTYTQAERHLKTAGDFKPIHLLSILGGSMPFDPVLNKINGRTARLKKEIKIEQSELLQQRLSNMFEDTFFVDELKISPEHVAGFKVFAAEKPELATTLTGQNKTLIANALTKLAVEYQNRIVYED